MRYTLIAMLPVCIAFSLLNGCGGTAAPGVQIVGSWYHSGSKMMQVFGDDIAGLELTRDNKVLMYNLQGQSLSWSYSALDNNRLSISQVAGGLTMGFKYAVSSDTLTLVPDDEQNVQYAYRRLKGQSIPEAAKAEGTNKGK